MVGAQASEVGEPHQSIPPTLESNLIRSEVLIQVEFEEVVEPKELLPADLLLLVQKYGSCIKTAAAIGTSEAFVRQNCLK